MSKFALFFLIAGIVLLPAGCSKEEPTGTRSVYPLKVGMWLYNIADDTGAETDVTRAVESIPLGEKLDLVAAEPRKATNLYDNRVYDYLHVRQATGREGLIFANQVTTAGVLAVVADDKANLYRSPRNVDATGYILPRMTVLGVYPETERDGFVQMEAFDPANQAYRRNLFVKTAALSYRDEDVQFSILLQTAVALDADRETNRRKALFDSALQDYPGSIFADDIRAMVPGAAPAQDLSGPADIGVAIYKFDDDIRAMVPGAAPAQDLSGPPDIGVAIYKFDDTFMSYTRNAIEANAKGVATLTVVDSQNAQPTQNDQVDWFISKKMKAIAINPVDRTATGAIINKARAANIPVVFFNREPFAEDMAKWNRVYYVGAKAEEPGTMQGEILAEYWRATPTADKNGDGRIQYIMLKGEPGHQDAELRTEYSVKAILNAGIQVDLLAEDTAMWDRPRAVEKMDAFYARFGDRIEAVLCNNDDMALGVIESLRNAGFFTGDKYLPVVGVDATAPALQALSEGTLLGTVLNDAHNQGKATYDTAYALATGGNVGATGWTITNGKYIWVPYQKVTQDNYTQFR